MTYIVMDPCIKCKYMDCVEVCPVDCFYEARTWPSIRTNVLTAASGEPECLVDAIKPDTEDDPDGKWLKINTDYAKIWPNITLKGVPPADRDDYERETGKFEKYFSEKARQRFLSRLTGILHLACNPTAQVGPATLHDARFCAAYGLDVTVVIDTARRLIEERRNPCGSEIEGDGYPGQDNAETLRRRISLLSRAGNCCLSILSWRRNGPVPAGDEGLQDNDEEASSISPSVITWSIRPMAGNVVAVENQEVAGYSLEVYVITFDHEKMTLRVPTRRRRPLACAVWRKARSSPRPSPPLKGRARVKRTMSHRAAGIRSQRSIPGT